MTATSDYVECTVCGERYDRKDGKTATIDMVDDDGRPMALEVCRSGSCAAQVGMRGSAERVTIRIGHRALVIAGLDGQGAMSGGGVMTLRSNSQWADYEMSIDVAIEVLRLFEACPANHPDLYAGDRNETAAVRRAIASIKRSIGMVSE